MSEGESGQHQPQNNDEASPTAAPLAETGLANNNSNIRLVSREKEALILRELSATIHTIENVSTVLEDIVRLTTPSPQPRQAAAASEIPNKKRKQNSSSGDSNDIATKQQKLLKELRQWKQLLPIVGTGKREETVLDTNS